MVEYSALSPGKSLTGKRSPHSTGLAREEIDGGKKQDGQGREKKNEARH